MKKTNKCNCLNAIIAQSHITMIIEQMKDDDNEVYINGNIICKDCHKTFNITYPKIEMLEFKLMFGKKKAKV